MTHWGRSPRSRRSFPLLLLLLIAVAFLLSVACAAEDVDTATRADEKEPHLSGEADPYAYLETYDLPSLKKYAFDTYAGKLDVERFTDHKSLLRAVVKLEKQEDALMQLRRRVQDAVQASTDTTATTSSQPQQQRKQKQKQEKQYQVVLEVCEKSHYLPKATKLVEEELYLGQDVGLSRSFNVSVTAQQPPPLRKMLSQALRAGFFGLIAVGIVGGQFLPASFMRVVEQRRGMVLSTGMVLNMLSTSLLQTGAFEVYVDGTLVYSKLVTARVPEGWELSKAILEQTVLAGSEGTKKAELNAAPSLANKQQQG